MRATMATAALLACLLALTSSLAAGQSAPLMPLLRLAAPGAVQRDLAVAALCDRATLAAYLVTAHH